MKVLLSWLREFVPIPLSAHELASALSLAGTAVDTVEPLAGGDALLDLDLTSNRPDCLSHYGVAREIAAITGQPLAPLAGANLQQQAAGDRVVVEAPEACGLYCALRFDQVQVRPAPAAVSARLEALDQRSINNVADATNYTLWEMGHPTHAFDYDKIEGDEIHVRWARPGETLTTLDGITRTLAPEDLVIADKKRPIALAGVIGGLDSAISASTTRVLLEAAWFAPLTVRKTARRHGLHTEASHRFERGADPQAAALAAARIASLLGDAARVHAEGIRTARGNLPERPTIRLRPERITRILGMPVEAEKPLTALGCEPKGASRWRAPSWRPDLTREIDLIEELARLHGYARFPSRLPPFQGMAQPLPEAALRDRVRQQLRGCGFAEAISLSFASEAECRAFAPQRAPVRVTNPLSEEAAILRTSSFPSMLHLLQYNAHRGNDARLFEIGKLYQTDPDGKPAERWLLTLGACAASLDFRAFRGEVEAVLAAFHLPPLTLEPASDDNLAPAARLGDYAAFGRLQPAVAAAWKLPPSTWLAEIALDRCYASGPRPVQYIPPPRFPSSERDFSFLFANGVTWAAVEAALTQPPIPLLVSLAPAEVFRGGKLPAGHYSLLLRARFQSPGRTLRDDDLHAASAEIISRLRSLGGQQR